MSAKRRSTLMITIAICDSNSDCRYQLQEACSYVYRELHLPASIQTYTSGEELLDALTPSVDILLIDVNLTGMNGLDVARQIREKNTSLILIFVTDRIEAAAESYAVHAQDFICKPASQERITRALTQAIQNLEHNRSEHITFQSPGQWVRLPMQSILYIESARNKAIIHTVLSRYELYITMREVEEKLDPNRFCRCHSSYVINLEDVVQVNGLTVMLIDGTYINISKHRRKSFMEKLQRLDDLNLSNL